MGGWNELLTPHEIAVVVQATIDGHKTINGSGPQEPDLQTAIKWALEVRRANKALAALLSGKLLLRVEDGKILISNRKETRG